MKNFLFQFVGSTNICYASELSQVDPKKKEMILKTRNVSVKIAIRQNHICGDLYMLDSLFLFNRMMYELVIFIYCIGLLLTSCRTIIFE